MVAQGEFKRKFRIDFWVVHVGRGTGRRVHEA